MVTQLTLESYIEKGVDYEKIIPQPSLQDEQTK